MPLKWFISFYSILFISFWYFLNSFFPWSFWTRGKTLYIRTVYMNTTIFYTVLFIVQTACYHACKFSQLLCICAFLKRCCRTASQGVIFFCCPLILVERKAIKREAFIVLDSLFTLMSLKGFRKRCISVHRCDSFWKLCSLFLSFEFNFRKPL